MKVRIDGETYEGSGTDILEQKRQLRPDADEFPDIETYIWQMRADFIRMTDMDCVLPEGDTERMALAMIAQLAKAGALEVLEDE